jgi:hypothetical protein
MTRVEWHLNSEAIAAYRANDMSPAMAASLEAHLLACAACRQLVDESADSARADAMWSAIADRIDEPRHSLPERVLVQLGLRDHVARLLVFTPAFRVAWFGALVLVSSLAIVAANDQTFLGGDRGSFAFLVLAPLVPVLGVAAAFMPQGDPAHELTAAAPFSSFELLLIRSAAVLVASAVVTGLASLALPAHGVAAAWLLPSLGLTMTTLAFARWMPISVAAGALSGLWLGAAVLTARSEAAAHLIADYPAFHLAGQFAFLALALTAAASVVVTRRSFDFGRIT